jgi:fructose-specific phosphotransferase system IIC component
LATVVFGKELSAPGPVLAALFCTTLAPIAGQFGIIAGIIAGFVHLFMVETTAAWHGGLDLYNNGFAGGLTASLIIAVLQWYKTNRPMEDFER